MKKLLLSLALSLIAFGASATTFVPVQLLDPTGSSTGQTVVSTGALTPPGWGTVPLSGLTAIAANTAIANVSGSLAAPSATSLPSCSTTTSALQYTSGVGFSCNTNSANLNGAVFTGTTQVSNAAPVFALNDTSGTHTASLFFNNNGTGEWALTNTSSTNAWSLDRYVGGVLQDHPISVANSNGAITTSNSLQTGGAISIVTGTTIGSVLNLYGSGLAGSAQFYINTSGSPATYGFYNNNTGHSGLSVNMNTDVTTFFARPVFGSATPWDSANLNFATPPAIGGTTPAAGAFTTLSASGLITPTYPSGIKGNASGSAVSAGSIGEMICAQVTNGGSPTGCATNTNTTVSLTTVTPANVTSISLTAGDWDICGQVQFVPAGSTTIVQVIGAISTTSATLPGNAIGASQSEITGTLTTGGNQVLGLTCSRQLLSGTTTIYLVADASFGVSTMGAAGWIQAHRR